MTIDKKSYLKSLTSNLLIACLLFLAFDVETISAFDCPGSKTPPLVVKGKRFYDSSTNEYVPIKGIAYYPRPNDGPLSKGNSVDFYTDEFSARWRADIASLRELGVNAVRLYAVDPSANHDAFMCALQEAGIYVMLGLLADCEDCAIGAWVGVDAEPPLCYTSTLKDRGRFVIRSFSKYDNLMAFSAGNEVSIYADDGMGGPREANVPCQKKFLRDMREYASRCATGMGVNAVLPRAVPIGLVNWDGNMQSFDQHTYYYCRTDPNDVFENAEWFALNSYRQCDGSATSPDTIVGWPELLAAFKAANFPGPVVFGEYGCREQGFPTIDGFETQRTWYQAEALYTPTYSDVFAGGFVYEYSAEKDVIDINLQFMADRFNNGVPESEWPYEKFAKHNYGLGYYSPSDCQHGDVTNCVYKKYPEWDGLVEVFAKSDAQNVRAQSPSSIPPCPERFQPLSAYDWPTDEGDDPELNYCLDIESTDAPTTETAPVTPATRAPTAAPADGKDTATTDVSTTLISTSESDTTVFATLSPTVTPTVTTFVPTSLTKQDIATLSPTLQPTLSPTVSPTFSPTKSPIVLPTVSPTVSPTLSPNLSSTVSPTMSPTLYPTMPPNFPPTLSPTVSDSTSPTSSHTAPSTLSASSPTPSPTAEATEIDTAKCSLHPKCYALNLGGDCCPTSDGVRLGCCDNFLDEEEIDESESKSSARGVFYYRILVLSALSTVLGFW